MVGKDVERISIRNYRSVGALDLSYLGFGCGLCLSLSRSYAQCVDVIGACRLREHFCIRVYGQHGLRYGDLHYHAVVFVNGCFWHAHGCIRFKMPKTNTEFWEKKFERNKARDREQVEKLLKEGWRVGLVWECSILGKRRSVKITDVASRICYWLEEEPHERFREF